jgi:Bbp16-like protein
MILDERNEFADATSVAAAAGTALIGDVIDLGAAHRDIGQGQPVYLVITTDTEIITGGSAGTLKFQLASDAQAAIATDGTATVHIDTGTFVTDDAAANAPQFNAGGVICCIPLPIEGPVYERYLGILAVTATTTTTAGKINAFLTLDPTGWDAYAEGAN